MSDRQFAHDMADRITTNQSKLIVSNVRNVFTKGIHHLDKRAYLFISLHMGFIAHTNLDGFKGAYPYLGHFATNLLDSGVHVIEVAGPRCRNDEWADQVEKRGAPITAGTIREILKVARGAREGAEARDKAIKMAADIEQANRLARRWGLHLVADDANEGAAVCVECEQRLPEYEGTTPAADNLGVTA